MTLAIVRPAPECHQLVAQLQAVDIDATALPIMTFSLGEDAKQLPNQLQSLRAGDIVIAVSKAAITFSSQIMTQHNANWRKDVHYVAVGEGTAAHFAAETGQDVHFPQQADSEGVLSLPLLQHTTGQNVIILRGQNGRELMKDALAAHGANVAYCEVYQRQWLPIDADTFYQQWHQRLSGLVVTSQQQLAHLWQSCASQHQTWLQSLPLWVPSNRVAQYAQTLGFHTITSVNSATNSALFATLSLTSRTGKTDDQQKHQ
ncbi:uroporphyrinogen-III synthase [Thaumasiovibrio subtropicus]|uniref:uroporphyrinogen-III synthase n=1 Tax=Thaumasiovibrio subtropicus TaxID=1891207 RepID=UPI000B354D48|nr:uroporphyrinogen-III synthase [Thaumasiovibrio subtropicus]